MGNRVGNEGELVVIAEVSAGGKSSVARSMPECEEVLRCDSHGHLLSLTIFSPEHRLFFEEEPRF